MQWWPTRKNRRLAALGLLAACVVIGLGVFGAMRRASWIATQLLRDWAGAEIAEESGGVYQLSMGEVRFNWALRRVTVDSIALATLGPVNERRPQALPDLRVVLHGCRISGVHVFTLARGAGLVAASFGCRSGDLAIGIQRNVSRAVPDQSAPKPFLVFQRQLQLPTYAPRVRIGRVVFPRIALDVRLPRAARGVTRLELGLLQWSMGDLVIDPADPTAATRPLFSKTIDLAANDFTAHPSRTLAVRVGQLRTSLTDSTLEIRDAGLASDGTATTPTAASPYRRSAIDLKIGQITAQGLDYGALLAGLGVRARRVDVDALRMDVTTDKRLPKSPVPQRYRTPQRWMADLGETLRVDSVLVRNSEVVYREHAAGHSGRGVITFARIDGVATNLSHFDGRRTTRDSMTFAARAYLQDAAPLDVRVAVPLDAPGFDMTYRGSLGPMPAAAFNSFITQTGTMQIDDGQVEEVTFRVAVRNGVAVGAITPRYRDLGVSVNRSATDGIMGGGGIVGGAARGIANLAAKWSIREDNPAQPATKPVAGPVLHTFTPHETLIAFLWFGVRDGLLTVVKK